VLKCHFSTHPVMDTTLLLSNAHHIYCTRPSYWRGESNPPRYIYIMSTLLSVCLTLIERVVFHSLGESLGPCGIYLKVLSCSLWFYYLVELSVELVRSLSARLIPGVFTEHHRRVEGSIPPLLDILWGIPGYFYSGCLTYRRPCTNKHGRKLRTLSQSMSKCLDTAGP